MTYGITSFDNIFRSLLTIFQMLTMDSWTVPTYNLMDQTQPLISGIYFSTLIIFGSFCLLNLLLASIMDSFMAIQAEELKKEMKIEARKRRDEMVKQGLIDNSAISIDSEPELIESKDQGPKDE